MGTHGSDGPVNVSKGTHICSRAEDAFVKAAGKLGYSEAKDLQNLDANNEIERYYRYVGPNGRRQDSAHRYLHPKLQSGDYPNLHVLVEKQVVKILFDDNKRAVGVEYQTNPATLANPEFLSTAYTSLRTVKAKKMVVVSAGANATPGILERSGVGDPKVLQSAGVSVVEELPGVGKDYQDHHLSLWAYRTNLRPDETINGFQDGRFDIDKAIKDANELLGTNGMDAQGKFRPTEKEVDALGPEFRKAWDRDFKDRPDRPLMILALYTWYVPVTQSYDWRLIVSAIMATIPYCQMMLNMFRWPIGLRIRTPVARSTSLVLPWAILWISILAGLPMQTIMICEYLLKQTTSILYRVAIPEVRS